MQPFWTVVGIHLYRAPGKRFCGIRQGGCGEGGNFVLKLLTLLPVAKLSASAGFCQSAKSYDYIGEEWKNGRMEEWKNGRFYHGGTENMEKEGWGMDEFDNLTIRQLEKCIFTTEALRTLRWKGGGMEWRKDGIYTKVVRTLLYIGLH